MGARRPASIKKLVARRDELTQWLAAHSRLYKLGESIRTTRQKVTSCEPNANNYAAPENGRRSLLDELDRENVKGEQGMITPLQPSDRFTADAIQAMAYRYTGETDQPRCN